MHNFDKALAALDLALFEKIESQTMPDDKQSLLACQLAVRELKPGYVYLEIGSYLGGSIQPHLLDDKCSVIYSIDRRPEVQPDARGIDWTYRNNSTARMLETLKQVREDLSKIETIDGDTSSIDPSRVDRKVDLCFIDGEHTDHACLRDFRFCMDVLNENGVILFHDAQVTYNGIADSIAHLEKTAKSFRAYSLPNYVFAIEIGDFPMHKSTAVNDRLVDNYRSYIPSLASNDHYRNFYNRFPFGAIRRAMDKVRGSNVSN